MTDPTPNSPLSDKIDWLRRVGCNIARLPQHMHADVADYILFGCPIGGFATAVFSNNLKGAFGRADEENTANMRVWVQFIYNDAPASCQGSPKRVEEWKAQGGLLEYRSA